MLVPMHIFSGRVTRKEGFLPLGCAFGRFPSPSLFPPIFLSFGIRAKVGVGQPRERARLWYTFRQFFNAKVVAQRFKIMDIPYSFAYLVFFSDLVVLKESLSKLVLLFASGMEALQGWRNQHKVLLLLLSPPLPFFGLSTSPKNRGGSIHRPHNHPSPRIQGRERRENQTAVLYVFEGEESYRSSQCR